jgi:hypothetical protein
MKLIKATFDEPLSMLIQVDLSKDIFISNQIINGVKREALRKLKQKLEEQLMNIKEDDIVFTIEEVE